MKRHCGNCGALLNENSLFCPSCGTKAPEQNEIMQAPSQEPSVPSAHFSEGLPQDKPVTARKSQAKSEGTKPSVTLGTVSAQPSAGEMSFLHSMASAKAIAALNPFKCIFEGIGHIFRNLKTVFQNKKLLIPALVLGVIWIVLMLLQKLGFNPMPVKILSLVTFAQGGFSDDVLRAAGGITGKGIFATFFLSFFAGGNALKGYGTGIKKLFTSLKCKNTNEGSSLLAGLGLGFIVYNFLSGFASLWNSMAGVAAFFLALRSLGRGTGFFRNLLASFTAKKKEGVRRADSQALNRLTAGLAMGLALSVPLSMISFMYLPYLVGAALIITAIIIKIAAGGSKKQIAAAIMLFAISLTALFPLAVSAGKSDDEWAGTWTLKKVVIDDKSDGLSAYYAANPNDYTVEKVKVTETSYEHEFRYTGEEYISDIVELRDGEYVPKHYYAGEFIQMHITFDKPPKQLRENQNLELKVNFDVKDSYVEYFDYMGYIVYGWMNVYEGKEISKNVRVGDRFNNAQIDVGKNTTQKQLTISATTPYGLTDGEIMGLELILGFDAPSSKDGQSVEEGKMTTAHIYYLYEWKYGANNLLITTDASEGPGETDYSVPAAIVVSILGVLTTLGAAAAAPSASSADTGDEKGSTYKMVLFKEFGSAIRYNAPAVSVYARMVEITKEGSEISRMDLTSRIEIFSGSGYIQVQEPQIAGEYMGALIQANASGNTGNPEKGEVCFRFSGEGGTFQNNVTFRLIGDPYIDYLGKQNNQLYLLAGSGREFTLACVPKDFMASPVLKLQSAGNELFDIRLEPGKADNYLLIATDKAAKPENIEKLFDSFRVELTAESDQNEFARSSIEVILCYEGLVPDWHGRDKEIYARYADREKKEMVKTAIGFSIGVWNETNQILDVHPSGDLEITVEDEKELYKTIGVSWELDTEGVSERVTNYLFTAEKPFPSENAADMHLTARAGELTYQSAIKLIPDVQQYSEDLTREYDNCIYIIETYMEGELRAKRLEQCRKTWSKFGLEDYKVYRKLVWRSAENQILQKRDSYLSQASYADTAIVALEFAKNVGDIALDMALAPIGGPFASILIGQAKDSVLQIIEMIANDNLTVAGFKDFLNSRFDQMIGMMDNFFDPPEMDDPNFRKKATIWFTCYFIYRTWYHITYDKDDDGNPAGVVSGVKAAVQDMTMKAVMVAFMGEALDAAKPKSGSAKLVDKTGYSKDADSELAKAAVSSAAEVCDKTAAAVLGFINGLLGRAGSAG